MTSAGAESGNRAGGFRFLGLRLDCPEGPTPGLAAGVGTGAGPGMAGNLNDTLSPGLMSEVITDFGVAIPTARSPFAKSSSLGGDLKSLRSSKVASSRLSTARQTGSLLTPTISFHL